MFYNVKNLKFINIYDIQYNDIFMNDINDISEINDNNIFVCQNENIITNINYKYYNGSIGFDEYECQNYIIIYYNQTTEYDEGFFINGIDSRKDVLFIINENNKYYIDEKLNVKSQIKLCFKKYVTSLKKFKYLGKF